MPAARPRPHRRPPGPVRDVLPRGRAPAGLRTRAAAVAVCLALGTGQARAAPSARDLAYEQAAQADEAGDPLRAAAGYERAYRLTAPEESGPRLLFLRASVAARLRAHDGSDLSRVQLCLARALLRDHLGAAPATSPDPQADERASLARVESLLAAAPGPPCVEATVPPVSTSGPDGASPNGASPGASPVGASGASPGGASPVGASPGGSPGGAATPAGAVIAATPAQAPAQTPVAPRDLRRALKISGGVGLGVGGAAFALLAVGVVLGRRATERLEDMCRDQSVGCKGSDPEISRLLARGERGDPRVKAGAGVGGLGVLVGVTLLALGARRPARARVTLAPRLAPDALGLGLAGRF